MTCKFCDKHCTKTNNCRVNCENVMSCENSERREYVNDCSNKTVVLLESTGIKKICNINKIILQSVIVAGPTKQNDITDVIKEFNHIVDDTPVESIYIDTGKLNSYGGCDVECGHRKSVRIGYITETLDEITPYVTYDMNEVCNKIVVNHHGKKKCGSCNRHPNHCQCHIQTLCSCCNKYCCLCIQPCIKCHKELCICVHSCRKCHKELCICVPSCRKCHKNNCCCKPCPKVKMCEMLYIPLYPIARPYMCANPKFCKCVGKCDC